MTAVTRVHPRLSIGGQIGPQDIPALVRDGVTDILCNRPDGEDPASPASPVMARAAAGAGLRFHYAPIVPGGPVTEAAECLAGVLRQPGTQVFAYCRSGARSSAAWAAAQASVPAD